MEIEETLNQTETLLKKLEAMGKFGTKFRFYPYESARAVLLELTHLAETLPEIEDPQSYEDVVQAELKRRLAGEAKIMEVQLSGSQLDFNTTLTLYNIPLEDCESAQTMARIPFGRGCRGRRTIIPLNRCSKL